MLSLKLLRHKFFLLCFCMWSIFLLAYYGISGPIKIGRIPIFGEHLVNGIRHNKNDEEIETPVARTRLGCVQPHLQFNETIMMKQFKRLPPIECQEEPDWVYIANNSIIIRQSALNKYKPISCDYYKLERDGDYHIKWASPIMNISDGFKLTSDYVKITCAGAGGKTYDGIHLGVAVTNERAERTGKSLPTNLGGMSIAILGFDSMSRMSWLRRLTKTRELFHDKMGAIELEAHNIVGDGTTAVVLPMLTGKFEWELPECRRHFKNATTLDNFPFLWQEMKKAGYLTSWCNAETTAAPFNYRMLGFSQQPTDFYTRPFYMAHKAANKKYSSFCMGSRKQSQVWLNYFRDIFTTYKMKQKFLFHFLTDFSHDDNNLITLMDEDIHNLVEFLWKDGYLNNTLLILMGDHGARYGSIRSSLSGKLEERLPYFSLLFPDWFQKKYPQAMQNLKTNSKRLTTPFDLYETFKDILDFQGSGKGNLSKRGISLFKEIPPERSCQHANIAPHWCACLEWKNVSVSDKITSEALKFAIDTINNYTLAYRDLCARLFIGNVTMATIYETRSEVLKFKETDSHGGIYKIDLTDKKKNVVVLYQLTFYTSPGEGHFEVTVTHDLVQKIFSVNEKEISRINKYGNDPICILDKDKQIRQFCYCIPK